MVFVFPFRIRIRFPFPLFSGSSFHSVCLLSVSSSMVTTGYDFFFFLFSFGLAQSKFLLLFATPLPYSCHHFHARLKGMKRDAFRNRRHCKVKEKVIERWHSKHEGNELEKRDIRRSVMFTLLSRGIRVNIYDCSLDEE